jgi:hypothetical protein
MIGISPERLRRAIKAKQVRAIKLGAKTLVARAAVLRLAEASEHEEKGG